MQKHNSIFGAMTLPAAISTILLTCACGGKLEPGAPGAGGSAATSTAGGSGGSAGQGTGGAGGTGGTTCIEGCGTAGPVRNFSKVDEVYAAIRGLWQLCPTLGIAFDAPPEVIGIEFLAPKSGGIGDMYYLVRGASGAPTRGVGSNYQRTYDISFTGAQFALNVQRPTGIAPGTLRYSECPQQFEVNVSAMVDILARFP
jgi:hypothetical protein